MAGYAYLPVGQAVDNTHELVAAFRKDSYAPDVVHAEQLLALMSQAVQYWLHWMHCPTAGEDS